jgi:hypothetical protein
MARSTSATQEMAGSERCRPTASPPRSPVGGATAPYLSDSPALSVALVGQYTPAGLAIGPNGELYIGAGAVYRLSGAGNLQWVVGVPGTIPAPADWGGVYSNPAIQQDFFPAIRVAFDGEGDLLVAGGGGFGLYEQSSSGQLLFVENFRGDGFWGSLAPSPNGDVVLCARDGLSTFTSSGAITPVATDLDAPLGAMVGTTLSNTLICGDGAAVARDGLIYVDTNSGNTFTTVNAIVEVPVNGAPPSAVWRS